MFLVSKNIWLHNFWKNFWPANSKLLIKEIFKETLVFKTNNNIWTIVSLSLQKCKKFKCHIFKLFRWQKKYVPLVSFKPDAWKELFLIKVNKMKLSLLIKLFVLWNFSSSCKKKVLSQEPGLAAPVKNTRRFYFKIGTRQNPGANIPINNPGIYIPFGNPGYNISIGNPWQRLSNAESLLVKIYNNFDM